MHAIHRSCLTAGHLYGSATSFGKTTVGKDAWLVTFDVDRMYEPQNQINDAQQNRRQQQVWVVTMGIS